MAGHRRRYQHILLADNNSTAALYNMSPGSTSTLLPYLKSGFLDIQHHSGHRGRTQVLAYNDCIQRNKQHMAFDWLAFLDADEYVYLRDPQVSLPSLVASFAAFGGLVLNWQTLATSGHLTRPAAGVLASYTACLPPTHPVNSHVKSMVNAHHVVEMVCPHCASYEGGHFAVNTAGFRVDGPFGSPAVFDAAWIYHYGLRSREDYASKMVKGTPDDAVQTWGYFDAVNAEATDNCTLMQDRLHLQRLPLLV